MDLCANCVDLNGVLLSTPSLRAKRARFEHADWYQSACSKGALLAGGQGVLRVNFLAPFGPFSNVPIGTNRHVQRGPFWRGGKVYSEGHHCVQHGLHYDFYVGRLNVVDPNEVLLGTLSPSAIHEVLPSSNRLTAISPTFAHANWYQQFERTP